ncbi:hypothetical protein CUR86_09695 [Salinicola acroporae]|uniref:Uncharacterized protein n=1 Tax=Salinicola acroporae TaxID=1541440 RepID=A0ABT6I5D8_9GAMM|nr:hypothetical protein [Salinicola acroporae]
MAKEDLTVFTKEGCAKESGGSSPGRQLARRKLIESPVFLRRAGLSLVSRRCMTGMDGSEMQACKGQVPGLTI